MADAGHKRGGGMSDKAQLEVDFDSSGTESDEEGLDLAATAAELGDMSEDGEEDDLLDVDFDFVDPRPVHFKSVRRLVEHLLPGEEKTFDASGLADLIVAQASVGTMVTVPHEEGGDAYAFATALNVSRHAAAPSLKAVRKYLLGKAPSAVKRSALAKAWDAEDGATGLILSERMLNMPPEIAPTLYSCLMDDLAWARENEISEEHKQQFHFKRFVLIAPCFMDKQRVAPEAPMAPPAKRARTGDEEDSSGSGSGSDEDGEEMLVGGALASAKPTSVFTERYLHFEEELLEAGASLSFAFTVEGGGAAAAEGAAAEGAAVQSKRRVLVFPAAHLPKAVAGMAQLLAAAQADAEEEALALAAQAEGEGGEGQRKRALPASVRARKLVVTPAGEFAAAAGQGGGSA